MLKSVNNIQHRVMFNITLSYKAKITHIYSRNSLKFINQVREIKNRLKRPLHKAYEI